MSAGNLTRALRQSSPPLTFQPLPQPARIPMEKSTRLARAAFDASDTGPTAQPSRTDTGQESGSTPAPVRVDPKDLEELMNRLKDMLYGGRQPPPPARPSMPSQ